MGNFPRSLSNSNRLFLKLNRLTYLQLAVGAISPFIVALDSMSNLSPWFYFLTHVGVGFLAY